jgi:hypothetical protein
MLRYSLLTLSLLSSATSIDTRQSQLLRGLEEPAGAAALGGEELRVSGDGIDHVAQGFQAAKTILSTSSASRTVAKETCTEEQVATEKWVSSGLNEDKDAAAARAASKAALAGALGGRIDGLKKMLERLKRIRARLYQHIVRVNDIYGSKFKENMNYMNGAVQALHSLSVVMTTPISPKLSPIKNFIAYEPPSAGAVAAEKEMESIEKDAEVGSTTSMFFVEVAEQESWNAQNMRFASLKTQEDECCSSHSCPCSAARQEAFELYEKALELNAKMSVNFEAERKVLAAFRSGLRTMIESREANLAALTSQLNALAAAMNATEEPIQGLFGQMQVHLDVLKSACAQQQENAKVDVIEIQKLISLIQEHHVGAPEAAEEKGEAAESPVVA